MASENHQGRGEIRSRPWRYIHSDNLGARAECTIKRFIYFSLHIPRAAPYARQKVGRCLRGSLDIRACAITGRAKNTKVASLIRATLRNGPDVIDNQNDPFLRIDGGGIATGSAAELTGKSVALEYLHPELCRDVACDDWLTMERFEKIFVRI